MSKSETTKCKKLQVLLSSEFREPIQNVMIRQRRSTMTNTVEYLISLGLASLVDETNNVYLQNSQLQTNN
ncbi:MAG: hypothetical protein Kapaf2KO_23830 [Candidatus Kapaibacteriales bacterium]